MDLDQILTQTQFLEDTQNFSSQRSDKEENNDENKKKDKDKNNNRNASGGSGGLSVARQEMRDLLLWQKKFKTKLNFFYAAHHVDKDGLGKLIPGAKRKALWREIKELYGNMKDRTNLGLYLFIFGEFVNSNVLYFLVILKFPKITFLDYNLKNTFFPLGFGDVHA